MSAEIPIGPPVDGVEVPADAVVRWQGKLYAFAEVGKGEFARQQIPTNIATPNGWLVRSGFDSGAGVVVRGAQLLLSQEMQVQPTGSAPP